jgi:hypothetical protein
VVAAQPSPPPALCGENQQHVPWLLRKIWDRVNTQNEHFMGVIVGREGSGKSHTAIRIANEVDPTFDHERVIFDVAELLGRLKDGKHEQGNFYVLDEAGVQLGRRTWQERSQILANQALQLIRDHNLGLVFTLPRLGEFDSQAQGRLQAAFEITEKVDGEYVRGKWKWFDPDRMDETGTIYKKLPRRRQNGSIKRIRTIAFGPPESGLVEPYEERKDKFQNQFYQEVIESLEDAEEDGDSKQSVKEIAAEVQTDGVGQFVSRDGRDGSPYINKDLIRAEYEISHADARTVKALLEETIDEEELQASI